MNISIVIPTYWGKETGSKSEDLIFFDHPTPLNEEGTLARALRSLKTLKGFDYNLIVIAAAASSEIEEKVEDKVREIIKKNYSGDVFYFSHSHLKQVHTYLEEQNLENFAEVFSLKGYSQVRNMCTLLPHLLGSDLAVLFDDDELFEDPDYLKKAVEFIGTEIDEKQVWAKAGPYIVEKGGYLLPEPGEKDTYGKFWDKNQTMNKAFREYYENERIRETPFAFGGNMVIHKELFTKVPFDPEITRGEDIDYLINARLYGFSFFVDSHMTVRHLPPAKKHPRWKKLRQDGLRFIYEHKKVYSIKGRRKLNRIYADDFMPYPGTFIDKNFMGKILSANLALCEEYTQKGQMDSLAQALENINIFTNYNRDLEDPISGLMELTQKWRKLTGWIDENRGSLDRMLPEKL